VQARVVQLAHFLDTLHELRELFELRPLVVGGRYRYIDFDRGLDDTRRRAATEARLRCATLAQGQRAAGEAGQQQRVAQVMAPGVLGLHPLPGRLQVGRHLLHLGAQFGIGREAREEVQRTELPNRALLRTRGVLRDADELLAELLVAGELGCELARGCCLFPHCGRSVAFKHSVSLSSVFFNGSRRLQV
jgi:hypothetical protein